MSKLYTILINRYRCKLLRKYRVNKNNESVYDKRVKG